MAAAKAKTTVRQPKPPGRRRSGRAVYWLLAGALLLGMAAGLTYFRPALWMPKVATAPNPDGAGNPDVKTAVAPAPDPLEQRQLALAEAEARLKTREAQLKDQEAGGSSLLASLIQQRSEADAVGKAAAMYSAMPPYKAAPLMQALEVDLAVQVLRLLDEEQAGAVVMYMDPARGAEIMKQLMKPAAGKTGAKE